MTFTQQDIVVRLKSLLPRQWFGDETPVLDAVLNALAAGWLSFFGLLSYFSQQSRMQTMTGRWLDMAAIDFSGRRMKRNATESDASFRSRLIWYLNQDRCTRAAIDAAIVEATGISPDIFEPANPSDTGCYGQSMASGPGTIGYGVCGGWGSLTMPFQAFITIYRPPAPGLGLVAGWGDPTGSFTEGSIAYGDGAMPLEQPTDQDLLNLLLYAAPAGCILWTRILDS